MRGFSETTTARVEAATHLDRHGRDEPPIKTGEGHDEKRPQTTQGLKIGHPDPGPDAPGDQQAQYEDRGRVNAKLMGNREPKHKTGDRDGDPADQTRPSRFDARSWLVHSAAAETWPARTSSVVLRTRFRSRRTCEVS